MSMRQPGRAGSRVLWMIEHSQHCAGTPTRETSNRRKKSKQTVKPSDPVSGYTSSYGREPVSRLERDRFTRFQLLAAK